MVKKYLVYFLVALNLIIMGVVAASSVKNDSPTSDEPPHLLSGYVALKYGHDYIDTEHPLLAKTIAAFPLVFEDPKVNLADPNYTTQRKLLNIGKLFSTSRNFLNYQGNSPDQLIYSARIMMVLLTIFFGVVVFLFASNLFGPWVGALAVFLYSTEPNILANGAIIDTDMAAAGFIFTTVFALYLYSKKQTKPRLIFLILALTAALLSKFSALYLAPIVVLLMFVILWGKKLPAFLDIVYLIAAVPLLICLFYGVISFRDRGLAGFIPISYIWGAVEVLFSISTEGRPTYLLGQNYNGGRVDYFPVLIATKTQLLTLVGFIIFLSGLFLKKITFSRQTLLIIFTPALIFFAFALISKFNIGVRHVLPVYLFLIIFAAAGFAWLYKLISTKLSTKYLFLTPLLLILVVILPRLVSITTTYPHFLSYYNALSGGTNNGWKIADDSNYDWGQDVKRLGEFVTKNHIQSIAFDNYTGLFAATSYYHIPVTNFYPTDTNYKGWVALSTSVIVYHEQFKDNYSWLVDNYQPVARAGKSIFIYNIK